MVFSFYFAKFTPPFIEYIKHIFERRNIMETNFMAMVGTADEKYRKLVDYICQLKNGSDVEFDKIFKLTQSIHEDEISLIVSLYEAERMNFKPELQIPSFMAESKRA